MIPFPKRLSLFVFALCGFAAAGRCAPAPADDEARFLAGLAVPTNSPLEALASSPGWKSHAADFDQDWAELNKHQLLPIQAWGPGALGHFFTDTGPLLYFFSGPDFLYAHTYFPNASTYVLCGIEPIGPLPQVEDLPPQTLGASLGSLLESLDSILNFSFFITKKMKTDLEDSRLSGTLPLLYVFLARTGCHIQDVSMVNLDAKGGVITTEGARSAAPGVKIVFTGTSGQSQTMYYFSTDLSNGPVDHSGFLQFCASLGPARGFLKAASYLPHEDGFSSSRKYLLANCDAILEDDSGIPVRYFAPDDWTIHLFGNYKGPITLFKNYQQPEMQPLIALQKPAALPFSVGYRWHSGESSLVFAVKATHAKP
jgi:hypothetical protein